MNELVNVEELSNLRVRTNNECIIHWASITKRLLNVYINNEEYKEISPEEVIEKFGTNFTLMQELRYLMNNRKENIEPLFEKKQSIKKEIIDWFISLMEEDNIFKDHLFLEEIKSRLEKNIDAIYSVDESYREGVKGWYNAKSRNIYVKSKSPDELKEFFKTGNLENLDMSDFETICHECIHALSPQGVMINSYDTPRGVAINEGLVQFFTNKITLNKFNLNRSNPYDTYSEQVEDTERLITIYGEKLVDAYFQGNAQNLFNDPAAMGYVMTSDLKLLLEDEPEKKNDFNTVNEMNKKFKKDLVTEQGIDLFSLIKYGISWPYELQDVGIKKDALIKFMRRDSNEFKELLGNVIFYWRLRGDDEKVIWDAIQEEMESQGDSSIENILKYGLIHYNDIGHVSKMILNDNNFDSFLQETPDIFKSLLQNIGEDESKKLIEELLYRIYINTHEIKNELPDSDFKYDFIRELTSFKIFGQLEQIIENISSIQDWEYYKTKIGKCVMVNSKTGNIQVMDGECGYGYWLIKDNGEDEFCIEQDEEGKYVLKSYSSNVDGEHIQLDIGLGRNFLDDTTKIDREIMKQTANLKISDLQSAMTKIETISKGNEEEKDREDE